VISEIARENHFEDRRVGSGIKPMADPELDIHGIALIVNHCEKCLLLSGEGFEVAQATVIGIVLEAGCPSFGKIVGQPGRRREVERAEALE
jgi:hypothetical protein